jgi:hypothetical protein
MFKPYFEERKLLLEEAENLEADAKRLRRYVENDLPKKQKILELLNSDLNQWRLHLAEMSCKSEPNEWLLAFWSNGPTSSKQNFRPSYAPALDKDWDFMEYLTTDQNAGPRIVAYSNDPNKLFHPDIRSRTRIELFSFTYLVCPTREFPKEPAKEPSKYKFEFSPYIYGLENSGYTFDSNIDPESIMDEEFLKKRRKDFHGKKIARIKYKIEALKKQSEKEMHRLEEQLSFLNNQIN